MRNNVNVWPSIIIRKSKIGEMSNTEDLKERITIEEEKEKHDIDGDKNYNEEKT